MGFLSVAEVYGTRGVELAGGEELLHVHPLVLVVWDLTVPGPGRDDRDAGPRAQVSPVGRAGHPVVARLLPGELPVGRRDRPYQRVVHRGLGPRPLLDHLQLGVEVRVFRFELREAVFKAQDEFFVGLSGHRADVEGDVCARGDHVDLGLPAIRAHQDRRGEARIAEERILAVALYLFLLQLLDGDDEPRRPGDGVDAAQGHRPVGHPAPDRDLYPQGALLLDAELVLLGFADDRSVDPVRVPLFDERLDSAHHPLLVHRMAEDEIAGKRYARVLDRAHRHHGSRQIPLGVARTPSVDASPDPLGCERRVAPVLFPSLRNHVGVRLEEQGLPRTVALPDGPDVRTPGRHLVYMDLEALAPEKVGDEPSGAFLIPILFLGTVDTSDADEILGEARQLFLVDPGPHRFEELAGPGVRGIRFGQLVTAGITPPWMRSFTTYCRTCLYYGRRSSTGMDHPAKAGSASATSPLR